MEYEVAVLRQGILTTFRLPWEAWVKADASYWESGKEELEAHKAIQAVQVAVQEVTVRRERNKSWREVDAVVEAFLQHPFKDKARLVFREQELDCWRGTAPGATSVNPTNMF